MMKKKVITSAIAALCCAGILAGCGASSSAAADTTSSSGTADGAEASSASSTAATAATGESGSIDGALTGVSLKIGTDTSFVPFCYPDDSNNYIGFDIDMIEAFSQKLGFTYEITPMDFTALLMSVQTEKLDMGAAGITIKPERQEVMDFSEPYYDAGLMIMVNKDNTDITTPESLAGKTVAVKEGTSSYDYLTTNVPDATLVTFPNIENAYLEVERGAADAVVYDSPNILFYLAQNPDSKCKTVGDMFDGAQYGFVFQKGSEYTALFDQALEAFHADGTYDEIYTKWFGGAE